MTETQYQAHCAMVSAQIAEGREEEAREYAKTGVDS